MHILGINAFGHDAAAVLLDPEGAVVFAASEERYDRQKHSAAFPAGAISAALAHAGLAPTDVAGIAFPWTRGMARLQKAWYVLRHLPRSLAFLRDPAPEGVPGRVDYLRAMRGLEGHLRHRGFSAPLVRVPHHRAHAASACLALPSPGRNAVLTADGMGEWTTTAAWRDDGGLSRLRRAVYPHSAGKAYSAVTQWLGFWPESDEGKTMGLAAYGQANTPAGRFARRLVRPDGRHLLRVTTECFGFPHGRQRLYGRAFEAGLGPPRRGGMALRPGDADVAAGIQAALEDVFVAAAGEVVRETAAAALGLAGGLFLNCALNGGLARALSVPVVPFPVAGDAGAAWGAAATLYEQRTGRRASPLSTLALGHELEPAEGDAALAGTDAGRPRRLAEAVAERVQAGALVGVARGRAEFGPRALGRRSVLASPRSVASRDRLNDQKGREAWRPLAPVVLEDDAEHFVDLRASPWMILTFAATARARELIPGAIHVDGTARVQTVTAGADPFLAGVLHALGARGEPPVVLNTSFNRRGEPIVNTAVEALTAARAMRLDTVVIGDRLLDLASH